MDLFQILSASTASHIPAVSPGFVQTSFPLPGLGWRERYDFRTDSFPVSYLITGAPATLTHPQRVKRGSCSWPTRWECRLSKEQELRLPTDQTMRSQVTPFYLLQILRWVMFNFRTWFIPLAKQLLVCVPIGLSITHYNKLVIPKLSSLEGWIFPTLTFPYYG